MNPVTIEFLNGLGFEHDERRPFAWRLWLPDEPRPWVRSYLQLIAPDTPHGDWTAELVNVVEGIWTSAAVPRPIRSQGHVYSLITALGGQVFSIQQLQVA